jgi:hypothetical protein
LRTIFPGYYCLTEEQLSQLWDTCIFVLDTNVLLNLYRYPQKARDDLFGVLERIADRLWIPHQVALEYQENRLGAIAEQVSVYSKVEEILDDTWDTLRTKLGNLQLRKRHSAIDPDAFLKKVEDTFAEFRSKLGELRQKQPDVFDRDRLRERIDILLEGKVGPVPTKEQLESWCKNGEKRYVLERPPGYRNKDKRQTYFCNGLPFPARYGDLILWCEIIEQAKGHENFKKIVFVTDEVGEDWWWIVKSGAPKTIGPRPELIDEIRSEACIEQFHMYNSERFVAFAGEHWDLGIDQSSIEQIREIGEIGARWVRKRITFLSSEESLWVDLFGGDARQIAFKYSVVDLDAIGGPQEAAHTEEGEVVVGISRTLETLWGLDPKSVDTVLLAYAAQTVRDKLLDGTLRKREDIQLSTYNAPDRPPFDPAIVRLSFDVAM